MNGTEAISWIAYYPFLKDDFLVINTNARNISTLGSLSLDGERGGVRASETFPTEDRSQVFCGTVYKVTPLQRSVPD